MKKILFLILTFFILTNFVNAQWPITQNLGSDSTLISVGRNFGGGIKGSLINKSYTDTTAANLSHADFYAGAQIFTTSDTSFWIRNKTATNTYWFKIGGAGGGATGSFWGLTGNYIAVTPANLGIGTNDPFNDLPFKTNNTVRLRLPLNGLERQSGGAWKPMLFDTTNLIWGYGDGGGTTPISSLTAATGSNSIDNGGFEQVWSWSSGFSTFGLTLNSNTTTASNNSSLLYVQTQGANGTAGRTTYSQIIDNFHTGTSSTNVGLRVSAASGTNNYAIIVPSGGGNVGIGTSTPTSLLHVNGAAGFRYVDGFQGAGKVLMDDGAGNGVAKWTTPSTVATSVPLSGITAATGSNTIDNGAHIQEWQFNSAVERGFKITSSSTASDGSDEQILFYSILTGSHALSGIQSIAIEGQNLHTGANSTNIGVNGSASGGTNNIGIKGVASGGSNSIGGYFQGSPYGIIVNTGMSGFGTITPSAMIHSVSTTEQLRIGYDASNYYKTTVGSTGKVTWDAVGSGAGFVVNDVSDFADTTNFKPVVINTTGTAGTQNQLYKATYWPGGGGGGGTPGGNFGNIQLNRNGAFATPASDSLDFESATGLTSLGNLGVGVTTSTYRVSILDNQTTRDVIKMRNSNASGYNSIGFFSSADVQVGGFGYANSGIGAPVTDAVYFYSASKDLVFSKDATATSSMTVRGSTGTVGIASNLYVGSATGTASALAHFVSTTEQLRLGYDASNYYSTTVGSTGGVTFNAVGAGSAFTFSDNLDVTGVVSTDGLNADRTITAGGTTGNQTINKMAGTVNFAAAATTLTVTNSLVDANSIIFCVVRTNDATATIKNVVPGSGSFVITLTAAATAETSVGFIVTN